MAFFSAHCSCSSRRCCAVLALAASCDGANILTIEGLERWCTEAGGVAWISMFRVHYVTRTEEGLATRIIRFSASTAIATSAC